MKIIDQKTRQLCEDHGIIIGDSVRGMFEPHELQMKYSMALDSQPTLVTQGNSGIPAFLLNYMDPKIIDVMVAPMNATKIIGEGKKGDWTTQTAMFQMREFTGSVSSYGDRNINGNSNSNTNWVNRQSYLFQTMTEWGELELARAAEARINKAADINLASALTLGKFLNKSYFYGIDGLENYGLLNDPALPAAIAPGSKTAGGFTWKKATAAEITVDITSMFEQLQSQLMGLITRETPMVLAMSPYVEPELLKSPMYTNISVIDWIKKSYPNLRIETAVEYHTDAGEVVQLIADKVEGQDTGTCAFNEKLRSHAIVIKGSSFEQKKTSGTWGAIIALPAGFSQMIGV